jgi:hypothetical protein
MHKPFVFVMDLCQFSANVEYMLEMHILSCMSTIKV